MKFKTLVVLSLAVLLTVSVMADTRTRPSMVGNFTYGWFLYAMPTAHEAQRFVSDAITDGVPASGIVTLVTSNSQHVVFIRTVQGGWGVSPNYPFEWRQFSTLAEAEAEYYLHTTTKGLVTMNDGAIVVYWAK